VTWIRSEVLIIYCEDPLLPAQGKVAQVKIMLIPSILDKNENGTKKNEVDKLKLILIENGTKKNEVDKLKLILICFISFLSTGHRTIKRDATW
jgi:hypothetical protein